MPRAIALTLQTLSQIIALFGVILTAVGGFGAYHYGKVEDAAKDEKNQNEQQNLLSQITELYLLVLFKTDKGLITGKVRVEGSDDVSAFSTTANSNTPVALRNVWVAAEKHFKMPTVMEFLVTEKIPSDASLSIFTAGWIDTRDREPH
jgi:hypothetical protein